MKAIQEILEAHDEAHWDQEGRKVCQCGHEYTKGYGSFYMTQHIAEVLAKYMREREMRMRHLIQELVDPDPCRFDHHGGCQAHGYLDLEPGELCPHEEVEQLLKEGEDDDQEGTAEANLR